MGGAVSVEGELFVQHVTAPAEYQVTQPTTAYGKVLTDTVLVGDIIIGPIVEGSLTLNQAGVITGSLIGPFELVLTTDSTPDAVGLEQHSHVFRNLPLTLYDVNKDVRLDAQEINQNTSPVTASRRVHGVK